MKKTLLSFLILALALLVVGCSGAGGGGPTPGRGGSTTSTGGMEYVFTPDTSGIGSPSFFGLTYGNGTYVAVGNSGTVIASSDGTDWNLTENERSMVNIANKAKGHITRARFLAGPRAALGSGFAGKRLPAGRTLINGGSSEIDDNLIGVAYGAGKFVAIGDRGSLWSSTDGASWMQVESVSLYWFDSIAFLNGKFVAFGYDADYAVVLTSNDGSSWTTTQFPDYYDFFAGAAYGNGVYVAVTWNWNGSPIFTSTNSNDWTAVSNGSILLPASFYQNTESGYESEIELTGVAFHDGVFVAVGTAVKYAYESSRNVPLILVSTDGTNWSSQDLPDLTPPGLSGTIEAGLAGITATDAGFVAVGDFYTSGERMMFASSIVMTSTTGRSWQHDYFNSSLSGAVVSGNGISAIGLGDCFLNWWRSEHD